MRAHHGTYDYIVIGAGSAGSVVANRLTADGGKSVLLLEAGPLDNNMWIHIPAGVGKILFDDKINWMYFSEPEPHLGGRHMYHPRGKVLGGTSTCNGMAYIRGHAMDYDNWAQAGNPGWSWDDVLPLFRRGERNGRLNNEAHSTSGELGVDDGVLKHHTSELFFEAAKACGMTPTDDFNDGPQEGYGWLQFTIENGRRSTTAVGFLHPIKDRANLDIQVDALVEKIDITEGRARKVAYTQSGKSMVAKARAEIILCGGAFNSPHLLNLSGIGAGDELQSLGIDTIKDLPGVGKNLQDHIYVNANMRTTPRNSINREVQGWRLFPHVLRYFLTKRGHLAQGVSNSCLFATVLPGAAQPDVQIMFRPMSLGINEKNMPFVHDFPGFSAAVTQLRPQSRGKVWAASPDPHEKPKALFNYLAEEADMECLEQGYRLINRIYDTPQMKQIITGYNAPDRPLQTTDEIRDYMRQTVATVYHPVGTCKMGNDAMSVVDARLRVHGVEGLRVADASIMPVITSGNTNAPAIMIGEKCADMVLEDAA